MAKVSAEGTFSYFLGKALSHIVSAIGSILVARLLIPSEYGLVAIAVILPNTVALFRDLGINQAMIKHIAEYESKNEESNMRNVLISGPLLEMALGGILSLVSFSLAGPLATSVFHRPEIKPLIQVASMTVFAGSLFSLTHSIFTGFEKMKFVSLTLIFESSLKTLLVTLLVFIGYGAFGAILGYTLSSLATGILAILIFYLLFYRKTRKVDNKLNLFGTLRTLITYGFPLYISFILTGLLAQLYNFIIAIYCIDFMIGNYNVALKFSVLITFFTIPISTVLFPAFSKLNAKKEIEDLRLVFRASVKYAALVTVPVATAIIVLSEPLTFTLFGEKYTGTPFLLALTAVGYLYSGLGSLSLANLFNSQGKTRTTMKLSLINLSIGLPLSLWLVPKFGIPSLIVASLTAAITSLTLGSLWIRKDYGITIDYGSSAKIYLASGITALLTYLTLFFLNFDGWIELVLGGTTLAVIYLITASLIGAISRTDVNNLREILKNIKPFYPLFNLPLRIIERTFSIKDSLMKPST